MEHARKIYGCTSTKHQKAKKELYEVLYLKVM